MESKEEDSAAASLFTTARGGDREAFGRLLEMYRHQLEPLAYLSLGPRLRTRVDYEDVIHAKVGQVAATLRSLGRQHVMVAEFARGTETLSSVAGTNSASRARVHSR